MKLIDYCPSIGRTSQHTGRSAVRCWCLAETSSCWSSAFGTSPYPERGPTSMSSGPTSSGWVTAQTVYLIISRDWLGLWVIGFASGSLSHNAWGGPYHCSLPNIIRTIKPTIQTFIKLELVYIELITLSFKGVLCRFFLKTKQFIDSYKKNASQSSLMIHKKCVSAETRPSACNS